MEGLGYRCFRGTVLPVPARVASPLRTTLSATHAHAVASLLPLLGCGEEAASLAFDDIADRYAKPLERSALQGIALEERAHDDIIQMLIAMMPEQPDMPDMLKAARRFHIKLGRGAPAERLARIAALDSAVCLILSRLTRARNPIASDPQIAAPLIGIRNDEARHVSVSRALAMASLPRATLYELGTCTRRAFADVLMLGGDAMEALGIDPCALERDIRILPPGMFRS